ncbi:AbrB/MazE/SpoVT family DNA-binding domain-containing protein [Sphingomonas gilva]|uniref:AbrB/MazE/SpoVT family DNA-binding domain-containing protein n=1 Tax=Sphingomonas gilva TaxID=2305907 RepID=A0A396RWJ6_9SPHN|nr:AbrB/MazE/SpoVT family DNA-binding domain-containing protein [Sphingomonas gilva]RHW18081.1 AbrB/MazE/SpoVT family DNA-binding domain-containing protein [Sphingomonas gilva]
MTIQFRTKTFKSGNSVAIRLPKSLDIAEGTDVVVEQGPHGKIEISRVVDPAEEKRRLLAMIDALARLGPPSYGAEGRLPVDIPERPGL